MKILIDTSVWSLLFRRPPSTEHSWKNLFQNSLDQGHKMFLLGVILQELLDGLKEESQMKKLIEDLKPFPLLQTNRKTHILAAQMKYDCRKKGINAGTIDFLIAASAIYNNCSLMTADNDFIHISRHCDLNILRP